MTSSSNCYQHQSQLRSYPTTKDAVTIRSFRRADQAKCVQICLDSWKEFITNVTLDLLSKSLWYVAIATVFASLAALLWSTWILAVCGSIVFFLFALFCSIMQISSRQVINCWLRTDLKDIEKWYMSDMSSSHMWVAEWRGDVVGMVGFFHKESQGLVTNEIKRMYVESRCRRMGIGTKLIKKVITHAKRQKVKKIVLATSTKQLSAIRFYKKCGFKQEKGDRDRSFLMITPSIVKQSNGSIYNSLRDVALKIATDSRLELSICSTESHPKSLFASKSLEKEM